MRKTFYILLLLLFSASLSAETDFYRVMWNADPSTSMVIGWNQISGADAVVYYDTVDHGLNVSAYAYSHDVDRAIYTKGMSNRFARLSDLQPNTAYYFVIVDENSVSQRMWFKTTPNVSTERLSFIAGGDSRNNREQRQNANKLVAKLRPHAVIFGGDYTLYGTSTQWKDWFEDWQLTIAEDGRITPIVAARGNHELSNLDLVNLFDVPHSEVFYKMVFGGDLVSVFTLNSEIAISGTQTNWLDSELSIDQSIFRLAQYHKPVRSHHSSKSEGTNQYTYWVPLFDQYRMDLVVECDSHTSKTTWPVVASDAPDNDEGFIRDDINGTVYTGEGCWGAPLRSADDTKSWTRNSGMYNQFKWIHIDQNKIELRTVLTDNADSVSSVDDSDIFTAPENLEIFTPSTGDVVIITKKNITNCVGSCNDNDPCTVNDVFDADCNCYGTFLDSDNDSVCDEYDVCPGGSDLIDSNGNGIPDACDCSIDFTLEDIIACDGDNIILNGPVGYNSYIWSTGSTTRNIIVNESGTYSLSIVDESGCSGIASLDVVIQTCCDNGLPGDSCDDGNANTINDAYDNNCDCVGSPLFELSFRLLLEGHTISSSLQNNELTSKDLIPTQQPFNNNVWNYYGTESISLIPSNLVDWILIKIYDHDNNVIDSKPALLFTNGDVYSVNFTTRIGFDVNPLDAAKVSVHHRAHLAVIGSINQFSSVIDFTQTGNTIGIQQTTPMYGFETLICGDFDNNGLINNMDYNIWASDNSAVNSYLPQDADGNGIVNNLDYNMWAKNKSKVGQPEIRY